MIGALRRAGRQHLAFDRVCKRSPEGTCDALEDDDLGQEIDDGALLAPVAGKFENLGPAHPSGLQVVSPGQHLRIGHGWPVGHGPETNHGLQFERSTDEANGHMPGQPLLIPGDASKRRRDMRVVADQLTQDQLGASMDQGSRDVPAELQGGGQRPFHPRQHAGVAGGLDERVFQQSASCAPVETAQLDPCEQDQDLGACDSRRTIR